MSVRQRSSLISSSARLRIMTLCQHCLGKCVEKDVNAVEREAAAEKTNHHEKDRCRPFELPDRESRPLRKLPSCYSARDRATAETVSHDRWPWQACATRFRRHNFAHFKSLIQRTILHALDASIRLQPGLAVGPAADIGLTNRFVHPLEQAIPSTNPQQWRPLGGVRPDFRKMLSSYKAKLTDPRKL